MASMAEIREGFLCPICMKDLGSIADLQGHFDEEHAGEDKDVIKQFKGLFDKAKRKILGKESDRDDGAIGFAQAYPDEITSNPFTIDSGGIDTTMWEPQELGANRSHIDSFKRVRDARIDRYVVETNKLLIRLDKLLSTDAPTDPSKRKAFEKSIVPWAPDGDVNLCTTCGRGFSITKRRHHCRLCGSIICNKCSQFLPFSYAKKLTNPAFQYEGEGFHRSNSNSSLNSIIGPEGELQIRTCFECRNLLERRDQQIEQRTSKPIIVLLYEKMRIYIEEAEIWLPKFMEMLESLSAGDTTYNLVEAQQLRIKVIRLYEQIDTLSKRIALLGTDSAEQSSPRMLQLQKAIRMQASSFLQENMMGLQSLPSQQEIEQLQEVKRLEVQRRIEEERKAAAERELKRKDEERKKEEQKRIEAEKKEKEKMRMERLSFNLKLNSSTKDCTVVESGWKPIEFSTTKSTSSDDPMIQQMNIIKGYIKQAKRAQKFDEVRMLEENLKELQQEYWRQQNPAPT